MTCEVCTNENCQWVEQAQSDDTINWEYEKPPIRKSFTDSGGRRERRQLAKAKRRKTSKKVREARVLDDMVQAAV